ncbi:hypothetical protein [Veillonella sp. CAG:933]|jgi:hypothetical protein|uniref:hypothetical protein n=1 Tax=Veillonella sp. CAG:933 TaxID=1262980 RepID=UPI0003384769|nr:hypothetical protein [Veillonella sp. CAG:933]CCX55393.1 phage capside-related protein [Veillonella sp. CAG:933]
MATLNENLKSFAAALGNDYKALKSSISATDNKIGTLAGLETTNKGDIVTAMNELKESIVDVQGKAITEEAVDVKLSAKQDKLTPGSGITLTGNTISASVDLSALATIASVDDKIKIAVDKLVNGADATMDTFKEVQDLIRNDQTVASALAETVGKKVDYANAQTLTAAQKLQACTNIGIGDPSIDLVAIYNTAKGA